MQKTFSNKDGRVYATLDDAGTLHKKENERDRLRVSGGRSYAIDAALLKEAIESGGRLLEIREKTTLGPLRVFEIPLPDICRFGRRVNLAGIERWTIPLAACVLKSGDEEEWRLHDREMLLLADVRRKEIDAIRAEQMSLFSDEEKSYWKTRMGFET